MNTQETTSFIKTVDKEIEKFRKLQAKYSQYGAQDSETYWYFDHIIQTAKDVEYLVIKPDGFELYTSDEKLGKKAEKAEIALAKQAQKVYNLIYQQAKFLKEI